MADPTNSRGDRGRAGTWIVMLAAVLVFVAWEAHGRIRHTLAVSESYGVTVDPPAVDVDSSTGYALGRRSMVIPPGATDTLHWVMQTQAMFATGEWRIRAVDYDNVPDGREVHWASPFRWWLGLLAGLDHLVSGRPLGSAVERATLLSGPVMLALLLLFLTPFLAKRFSVVAAVLAAGVAALVFPFYIDFIPGRADHHGLANMCALGMVLFFVAGSGWTSAVIAPNLARRFLVGSALAGGLGLWVSAATLIPVMIGLAGGILVAAWFARRGPSDLGWMREPGLFRLWGWWGGAVSLAAYLLEYFPSHLGWRLEVNHPLYAIAWIGGGELLRVAVIAVSRGTRSLSRRDWGLACLAVGVVALPPLVIAITGTTTFAMTDPLLWWISSEHGAEARSLATILGTRGASWGGVGLWLPMLWLLPPLLLMLRGRTPADTKALLALAWVPLVFGCVLGWEQIRWLGLAGALSIPLLGVFFRAIESRPGILWSRVVVGGLVAGLALTPSAVSAVHRMGTAAEFTADDIHVLATRDLAHWLRQRAGGERVVVASAPNTTSLLVYYGGLSGVGTLYFENLDGMQRTAELFAAPTPEAGRVLAARLGVTHIVALSWASFETALAKFHRGLPDSAPLPTDLLIVNLLQAPVPPMWLRAIPFPLPEHPVLAGAQVRIWEVAGPQTPAEAAVRAIDYFLEMGQGEHAERLAPLLSARPADLPTAVMRAALASRQPGATGFEEALARVIALAPQVDRLELEDRVHLVALLTVGQRLDLAREQLRAAVRLVDERSLRRLTPGTLSDLLSLCDGLEVSWPDIGMQELAGRLLPPSRRP